MNKKWLILILIVITGFFTINNVKAYDIFTYSNTIFTEDDIYQGFSKIDGFDINEYKNIFCTRYSNNAYCYALNDAVAERLITGSSNKLAISNSSELGSYFYYRLEFDRTDSSKTMYGSTQKGNLNFYTSYGVFSNFNFPHLTDEQNQTYNVLDFSSYIQTEEEEPEINIKANKLLIFIIDKTKNIYELIINNPMLLFIISIPLVYVCFLIIYKIFKR